MGDFDDAMQLKCSILWKTKINYWLGTSHYSVVSWGTCNLKTFFFSAQLVSVQRFSALFLLRIFCLVTNLNFKCLAWHLGLQFLLWKVLWNCMELVFNFFWDALENSTTLKIGYSYKYFLRSCVPAYFPGIFFFYPFATAFEQVCGGIFDRYFFLSVSQKLTYQIWNSCFFE